MDTPPASHGFWSGGARELRSALEAEKAQALVRLFEALESASDDAARECIRDELERVDAEFQRRTREFDALSF